jgi:hypothetical protein
VKVQKALLGNEVKHSTLEQEKLNLTPKQIIDTVKKLQDNENAMKVGAEGHGSGDVLKTKLGRWAGIIPRSRTEGLTDLQKKWVEKNDLAETKISALLEKSVAPEAQKHIMQRIGITADDTPEVIADKMAYRRRVAEENIAASGPVGQTMIKAADRAAAETARDRAAAGVRQTRRFPDGSTHTGTLLPNGSFQAD